MKKIIYESLPSTQTEARHCLEHTPTPYVIVTKNQTAGYGRYGRQWISSEGNFAATFVVDLNVAYDALSKVPMLIAVKLCQLLTCLIGQSGEIKTKWPNDILLNKKKICGILIENINNKFLIGIGINLTYSPQREYVSYVAANVLQETGVSIDIDTVLDALSDYFENFDKAVTECDAVELRQQYMTRLEGIGHTIKVVTRNETLSGVLQDININGALVLDINGCSRLIYAADIFI
jgi:BirA family biotin operon repressor/biotin-[acetyl-CoA-carboxylase] ligase